MTGRSFHSCRLASSGSGGVLLIPFLIRYVPDYDLIIAGLVGGTGAYLAGRKFGSLS